MTPAEFQHVVRLLKQECGLVLTEDKGYLVESRLVPVARKWAKPSVDAFVQALVAGGSREMVRDLVEAMVTHESFFFRDKKPFDQFKDVVLPYFLKARANRKSLRIWCAACSSGQEPYSLAMILKNEAARLAGWKVEIVGTDISGEILERARKGLYSQFEVQRGLPIQLLVKWFKQEGEQWAIDPAIRGMVEYRKFNLLDDPRALGQFDIVLCRNVLIYFDQSTKTGILNRIAGIMPADGVLYLGGAETVLGLGTRFEPMPEQRGIYALPAVKAAVG